jgi:hypothetical protein
MTATVSDALATALLDARNEDGGWPATRPGRSNTEATALAIMALTASNAPDTTEPISAGRRWLLSRQRPDGGWSTTSSVDESSWMTAPAVLALATDPGARPAAIRGGEWLVAREGQGLGWFARVFFWLFPDKKATDVNTELTGWPWTAGTFSWIEPTAYSVLALKKMAGAVTGSHARRRIDQAEQLIYDRVCPGGGWNYGNARVLGESLAPYADTTALALMAVHDRAQRDVTRQSLRVLVDLTKESRSGLALGWAALCLDLYGMSSAPWRSRLRAQYGETRFLGKTKPLALAVLALNGGATMFRA